MNLRKDHWPYYKKYIKYIKKKKKNIIKINVIKNILKKKLNKKNI